MRGETENTFLQAVLDMAGYLGWRRFHPRPARMAKGWRTALSGDAGFVDLVLAKPASPVIFAELKTARGAITAEQLAWLSALSQAHGHVVDVWRPSAWELIEKLLRGQ